MPLQVSRVSTAFATRPSGSNPNTSVISLHNRPNPEAVRIPMMRVNSSDPNEKRPSASIRHMKRKGWWRLCGGESCDRLLSGSGGNSTACIGGTVAVFRNGNSASGSGNGAGSVEERSETFGSSRTTSPMSPPLPTRCSTNRQSPTEVSARPSRSALSRKPSSPPSARLPMLNSGRPLLAGGDEPAVARECSHRHIDAIHQSLQSFDKRHAATGRLSGPNEDGAADARKFEPRAGAGEKAS